MTENSCEIISTELAKADQIQEVLYCLLLFVLNTIPDWKQSLVVDVQILM